MTIELIDFLLLPMLFFIGLVTSWQDYQCGKIKNKWLKLGMIYGLVIYLFSWLVPWLAGIMAWTHLSSLALSSEYFLGVITNSLIALVVGFLSWRVGLMAAGDAKLFFIFAWLLPLKYYWRSYLPVFPSFALLLNIFIPVFVCIFFYAIVYYVGLMRQYIRGGLKIDSRKLKKRIRQEIINFVVLLVYFFVIFLLLKRFILFFIAPWLTARLPNEGFIFLVFYFLYRPLNTAVKKNKMLFGAALIVAVFYIINGIVRAPGEILSELVANIKMAAIFLAVIKLIGGLMDRHIKKTTVKNVGIDRLRAGIRLVDINFTFAGRKIKNELDENQVEILKKWAKKKKIDKIAVYQKFPFAVWIFLGVIITIVYQGSIINLLMHYFVK